MKYSERCDRGSLRSYFLNTHAKTTNTIQNKTIQQHKVVYRNNRYSQYAQTLDNTSDHVLQNLYLESKDLKKQPEQSQLFTERHISFQGIGLSEQLTQSLEVINIQQPTVIQEASFNDTYRGHPVAIAAETGSGKTLAYLLPIIQRIIEIKEHSEFIEKQAPRTAIILCINNVLCQQVKDQIEELKDPQTQYPYVSSEVINTLSYTITTAIPDIIICTPKSLQNIIEDDGVGNKLFKGVKFARQARFIVFDEADQTISGDIDVFEKITEFFKLKNRWQLQAYLEQRFGIPHGKIKKMNQVTKAAEGHQIYKTDNYKFLDELIDFVYKEAQKTLDNGEDISIEFDNVFRGPQFIFAGASFPSNGTKSIAMKLEEEFPNLVWLTGNRLHSLSENLQMDWHHIKYEDAYKEVLRLIQSDAQYPKGKGRIIVFASNSTEVSKIHSYLENSGINCTWFSGKLGKHDQQDTINQFGKSQGQVLVTTSVLSRGINIKDVHHIIQAEFAKSAIEFLHRVGRTARVGNHGKVTNLYVNEDINLVNAIRDQLDTKDNLQDAFSRDRSLSKKIKRSKRGDIQQQQHESQEQVEQIIDLDAISL